MSSYLEKTPEEFVRDLDGWITGLEELTAGRIHGNSRCGGCGRSVPISENMRFTRYADWNLAWRVAEAARTTVLGEIHAYLADTQKARRC